MQAWTIQDARARFNEMLQACTVNGPQMITKRGIEAAVLVPSAEWHRSQRRVRPTLKELLLAPSGRGDLVIPPRGRGTRRPTSSY